MQVDAPEDLKDIQIAQRKEKKATLRSFSAVDLATAVCAQNGEGTSRMSTITLTWIKSSLRGNCVGRESVQPRRGRGC